MAQISASFVCRICKEQCQFPQNADMVTFQILQLQFYKDHDRCERLSEQMKGNKAAAIDRKPPTGKKGR